MHEIKENIPIYQKAETNKIFPEKIHSAVKSTIHKWDKRLLLIRHCSNSKSTYHLKYYVILPKLKSNYKLRTLLVESNKLCFWKELIPDFSNTILHMEQCKRLISDFKLRKKVHSIMPNVRFGINGLFTTCNLFLQ